MSKTVQVVMNVEMNEIEKELIFEFEYSPAEKGSFGDYGQQMEPDIEDSMEFYAAYDESGVEIEISCKQEIECAREMAWQQIAND